MENRTLEFIKVGLKCDHTILPAERARLIALLKSEPKPEGQTARPSVMQRAEVARTLGRSLRFVDGLARRGLLRRVKLRERKRAIGVRADDVLAFVENNTVAVGDDGKAVSK